MKSLFTLSLLSASFLLGALPPPTNANSLLTPESLQTAANLSVRVTSLALPKWSSDALDIYRKKDKEGYIGWYDLGSKSFSGTFTKDYPQDTLMGAADVARQALFNNDSKDVTGIVTVLDPSEKPRCKIIFIGADGQPDADSARAFVELVRSSSDAVPEGYKP